MTDESTRDRIRNSLDETLIVEAAAGTGKTSELVTRIVNVLRTGRATVDRIVAVTFTRKAAGELRLRLRVELDKARSASSSLNEQRSLEDALSRLEEAHIGTIHAFCAELLRQRPVEARIAPGFQELDEHQSARLYNRAFDTWIQIALQNMSPGLRRALHRLASAPSVGNESGPLNGLRWAGRTFVEWRDFPAAWRRESFDQYAEIQRLFPELREFAAMIATCGDRRNTLRKHLQCVMDFVARLNRTSEMRTPNNDETEAMLVRLIRELRRYHTKGPRKFSAQYSRDEIVGAMERLIENLESFERMAGADLAALLQSELRGLVETYEGMKGRSGKLDFVDLLIRTRDLLRNNDAVRQFMQERFTHVFVDEFQDTDPLQAEILMLLSSDDSRETNWRAVRPRPGKLFMVGDPKQSIYRFRRADIIMYQELCRNLQAKGVGLAYLSRSFRAVRPIQEFVNAAFAPEMTGDEVTGQPSYVPLDGSLPAPDYPSIISLPAPRPYGYQRISNEAIERCLPETVAAYIAWLIEASGWKVRDPIQRNQLVPIASQHIAILFRRFMSFGEDITRDYVHALEVRNIPHVLWGARSFHQREEIETVRSALNAIEWPDDDLSMYATLRGSLFAIPDSLLAQHFSRKDAEPIASIVALIRDLHRRRNWRSPVETINDLLQAARAHAGFALRPSGNQILANVYRICDLARAYELTSGYSFRGFVEHLNAQAESDDTSEAPVLEEGAEGVRVMTVHAAKGLEFPIVILADMTANMAQRNADKHIDGEKRLCATRILNCSPWDLIDHEQEEHARDEAEGVRVAYVAATRARDLLVVTAVGDEPRPGWLQPLNKALYPPRTAWRGGSAVANVPAFADTTVLKRPVEYDGGIDISVRPGLHQPEQGLHSVAWWDPSVLELSVEPSFGLRQEEILMDSPAERAAASVAAYDHWKSQRAKTLVLGATPSMKVFVASEGATALEDYANAVRITRVPRRAPRPGGARFGTLVHLIMRDVSYTADIAGITQIAITHGRLTAAPEEEIETAVQVVHGAIRHALFEMARKAFRTFRELPIVLKTDDGSLLDAAIDLAFEDASGWTVVDFKTDAADPVRELKYRKQVGWYVRALEVLTHKRPTGWLLHL